MGERRGQRVVPGHVPAQAPRPRWCLERGRVPCPPPAQPPRIKGRLRRGETSGRPVGGRGAWVWSRGGAEALVLADPQETSTADLVWDTGSGCWREGETSTLSWLPGQVEGVLELTPTLMP